MGQPNAQLCTDDELRERIDELETSLSSSTSARDLIIRDLKDQLRILISRLDVYVRACKCPGEVCVAACKDCMETQALTDSAKTWLRT